MGGVYYTHGNQFFFSHLLAVSKSFFNYCTSDKLLDICSDYFKEKYRLKCLRYYENLGGQNMQWHTDNRNYTGKETSGTNIKNEGIIISSIVNVRSAPIDRDEKIIFRIHEGLKVDIVQSQPGWFEIILLDGKKGWIEHQSLLRL